LILDFGSQYTQLIARRIRECKVYCEIHPYDWSTNNIKKFSPDGVILSGGPTTVTTNNPPRIPDIIFQLNCPVLGICYGMQAMAAQLGGKVSYAKQHEYGYTRTLVKTATKLLENIEDHVDTQGRAILDVWASHGDQVTQLPDQFKLVASSDNTSIAAMANEEKNFYGLQFHPEFTHTQQGQRILQQFVINICQCKALWRTGNIIEETLTLIKKQVGKDHVILALSGGVDSSVATALLYKAIGKQLHCVFVDNGLLRAGEFEQVQNTFRQHFGMEIITIDAKARFLKALAGITDPEKKRKIIGNTFIGVFAETAQGLSGIKWLAQGTIYPDVIESAQAKTGKAQGIKSHHNVGGLPEKMPLKLLEPLRELFKDEVRKLGLELGLPHDMVYRHPFPGPGLGVRILGAIKAEYLALLRRADIIFIEELKTHDLYHKVSQAFAVFLPVRSVAVMGDARQYDYVIALRAVETLDFMTAQWARLPYDFLAHVSNRIINEISGISRVVYDISGKPPATIEWE
ncbi:MAG: glutamine-hydrolyzing GMP synthase, partial [Gammaproteobacteria bacterium]